MLWCWVNGLSRSGIPDGAQLSRGPCGALSRSPYRLSSPAVVGEGLVGLGHLVGVLATLHRGTEAVGGVEDLVHEPVGHGLLATLRGVPDQPAQRQGRAPGALDLDRDLVGRA